MEASERTSPPAPMPSTLGVVRSLVALLLAALLLAVPGGALAQAPKPPDEASEAAPDTDEDEAASLEETDETAAAGDTATERGGYEPDQRGAQGGEGEYEPDQRGGHEEQEPSEGADSEMVRLSGTAAAEEAEYIGGGRFIGFGAQLWLGASLIGHDAIDGANVLRPTQESSFGASFGVVGTLRLGPIAFGPRVGFTVEPGYTLAAFGFDVQAVLTSDRFAPFVRASLSYAFLAGVSDALPSQGEARVDGVLAEIGVGARFRIDGPFVIGAELSGGYLHLERGAVPACEAPCSDGAFDLATPGNANGLTLRLHVWTGVSF